MLWALVHIVSVNVKYFIFNRQTLSTSTHATVRIPLFLFQKLVKLVEVRRFVFYIYCHFPNVLSSSFAFMNVSKSPTAISELDHTFNIITYARTCRQIIYLWNSKIDKSSFMFYVSKSLNFIDQNRKKNKRNTSYEIRKTL